MFVPLQDAVPRIVKDKAKNNLTAAKLLAGANLSDAAASRAYYAAYQATVARLEAANHKPEKCRTGATDWNHDLVMNNAYLVRSDVKDGKLLRRAYGFRRQADYFPQPVDAAAITTVLTDIESYVGGLWP